MSKTILITGATGFIGKYLIKALKQRGDNYIALTTDPAKAKQKLSDAKSIVSIDDCFSLSDEKIDAVINLAGRNLAEKRWNEEFKKDAYDSRIETTERIVELISKMKQKPEVLLSASGIDYYGNRSSDDVYEDSPPVNDYMGNLCKEWESAALRAEQYGVRTALMRTGVVMAADAVSVKKLSMPFKFFVGGPIGSGKQFMSWIHIDDTIGIYLFVLDNPEVHGAVNLTAPNPETMKDFCKHMAGVMHRPSLFPVPSFVVKIVAGEMAEVVLTGRRALPKKITELGYKFRFEHSVDAWKDILK